MTKTTKATSGAARIAISSCTWEQGHLYEVHGEDSILCVADTFFLASGEDGQTYVLTSHRVPGFYRDDEGCAHPNRNYRTEADAFAARVERRGSIDPALWSICVERTWAEREAYNLRCEQEERDGWR